MGQYGFLYDHPCANGYGFERDDYRVYRAKNVSGAALKMARFIERRGCPAERVTVDYEADYNGRTIDLYRLKKSHPLYQFLP